MPRSALYEDPSTVQEQVDAHEQAHEEEEEKHEALDEKLEDEDPSLESEEEGEVKLVVLVAVNECSWDVREDTLEEPASEEDEEEDADAVVEDAERSQGEEDRLLPLACLSSLPTSISVA